MSRAPMMPMLILSSRIFNQNFLKRSRILNSGEAQEAPGRPAYSSAVEQFIASADVNSVVSSAIAKANRFQTLEMYVGVQLGSENITFGQQALWWGPGESSAFAFSNNAAPFYMLRFNQTKPLVFARSAALPRQDPRTSSLGNYPGIPGRRVLL
jgi:hypothetical protein